MFKAGRFEAQDLRDVFRPLVKEAFGRPLGVTKLEVIESEVEDAEEQTLFGAEGNVVLFIGRVGANSIDSVRQAARDPKAALTLSRELLDVGLRQRRVPVEKAVQVLVETPSFAELRYGGQMIAQHLFLPEGVDLVPFIFPYAGGRLAARGFEFAERYREGETDNRIEGIIVRKHPDLTDAERAAIETLPDELLANNVTPSRWCDTTWLTVATALIMLSCVTTALGTSPAAEERIHLLEDELYALGPEPSPAELLEIRRKFMGNA